MRPAFISLSQLACDENWCWKLGCTTCGHLMFRYGFRELVRGGHPDDARWPVHANKQGELPALLGESAHWRGSLPEQRRLVQLVSDAPIRELSVLSRFPDWLGHVGLVLWHTEPYERESRDLTRRLVPQFLAMLSEDAGAMDHLRARLEAPAEPLSWRDLDAVESALRNREH